MKESTQRRLEIVILLVAAHVIGLAAGLAALLFERLLPIAQGLFFDGVFELERERSLLPEPGALDTIRHALAPGLGGLLLGVLLYVLPKEARGHGVAEVLEAVVARHGRMPRLVGVLRMLTATITIGSGGSAGKEGPMVQIGASTGSLIGELFRLPERRRRVLLACGASAGIAAAFNAPFAGAVFAIEILVGEIYLSAMAPILIAAAVGALLRRVLVGGEAPFDLPALSVDYLQHLKPLDAVAVSAFGVITGFVAVLYTRAIAHTERLFERARGIPIWLKPAIGGLALGALGIALPQVLGEGHALMEHTLAGELPWALLLAIAGAKILATAMTLGSGGTGGAFAPAVVVGATLGAGCAPLAALIPGAADPPAGAFALLGLAGLLGGALHAPITGIVFALALTQDYHVVLPVMIATVASVAVASLIQRDSLYTARLRERGIDVRGGREESFLRVLRVRDHMRKVALVPARATLTDLRSLLRDHDAPLAAVVDDDRRPLGTLDLSWVREFLRDPHVDTLLIARELADEAPAVVTPDTDLYRALRLMSDQNLDGVLVVEPGQRQVVGMLSRREVVDAYALELRLRAEERDASTAIFAHNRSE